MVTGKYLRWKSRNVIREGSALYFWQALFLNWCIERVFMSLLKVEVHRRLFPERGERSLDGRRTPFRDKGVQMTLCKWALGKWRN